MLTHNMVACVFVCDGGPVAAKGRRGREAGLPADEEERCFEQEKAYELVSFFL